MKLNLVFKTKVANKNFEKNLQFLRRVYAELHNKTEFLATFMKLEGNECYKNKEYIQAVKIYNLCLFHTASDEQLALIYGNRSAACLELEKFEECLQNIQLARNHNFPKEKLQKLEARERRCLELMATEYKVDVSSLLKLSYEPNPKIFFLIDGLEVGVNRNNQKGIFATKPLKVGDIICIEEFIKSAPIVEKADTETIVMCSVCSKLKTMTLIPCKTCNFVLFCNEKCQKYHELNECHNSDFTFDGVPTWMIFPFSIFNKLLAKVGGSIDELEKLWTESQSDPKTIFDLDLSNQDDPECQKNQLRAFLSIQPPKEFKHLSHEGILRIDPKYKEKAKFIGKFFNWIFAVAITEISIVPGSTFAWFFSTFTSLIRCCGSANVRPFSNGGKLSFFVSRPIAAGEQIIGPILKHETDPTGQISCHESCGTCDFCMDPTNTKLVKDLKHIPYELLDAAVVKYEECEFDSETKAGLMKMVLEMCEILQSSAEGYPHPNYLKGVRILHELFGFLGEK